MISQKKEKQWIICYFTNAGTHEDILESKSKARSDQEGNNEKQPKPSEKRIDNEENVLIDLKRDTKNQSIEEIKNMLLKELYGNDWSLIPIPDFCQKFNELHIDTNKENNSGSNIDQASSIS